MRRVLFLCTANSARSQMSEVLTNVFRADNWQALSAAAAPSSQVHPMALATLRDLNISVPDLAPKSLDLFKDTEMDSDSDCVRQCRGTISHLGAIRQSGTRAFCRSLQSKSSCLAWCLSNHQGRNAATSD